MVAVTVELRTIEDTHATLGWAGAHTVVVDRPEGRSGGLGLGFNGAQLLALAIGGCFCNDLHYVADEMGVRIDRISVSVTVEMEGDPLIATRATLQVSCKAIDGSDSQAVVEKAKSSSMVGNSISRGIPVSVQLSG